MPSRRRFLASAAGAAVAVGFTPLRAQSTPLPITSRLLIGFPAGGAGDTVCRLLVEKMGPEYASSMIVENKPGAGGRIGADMVKNGDADGSLITLMPASMLVIYPHVYKSLRYNPLTDFAPISTACAFQFGLTVGPLVPANVATVQDFAKWCLANSAQASFGSPGEGTMAHFAGIMIANALGISLTHIPYKGGGPAMQDVAGGHLAASVTVLNEPLPFLPSGKVRVLATTGPTRSPLIPNAPTMIEAGYPSINLREYFALFAPAHTPAPIIETLSSLTRQAVASPDVKDRLGKLGFEAEGTTPAVLAAMVKSDLERWGPVVKSTGFTIDG